jgi:RNA polymerase sigma-70 factor, ECF subfamily
MYEQLRSARDGNPEALEWARRRYLGGARRWLRARLPKRLEQTADIDRLANEAFSEALKDLDSFENREGAFQLGLRKSLEARIGAFDRGMPGEETVTIEEILSPLEGAVGREACLQYESALEGMAAWDREAVVGRIEFGFGYGELAEMLGRPTPEAARAAVADAVNRLAEAMCYER